MKGMIDNKQYFISMNAMSCTDGSRWAPSSGMAGILASESTILEIVSFSRGAILQIGDGNEAVGMQSCH